MHSLENSSVHNLHVIFIHAKLKYNSRETESKCGMIYMHF
jgi:hypothetical protein